MIADQIDTLKPGTIIEIGGRKYIRMEDSPHRHIEGYIFDPQNGWWGHWSRIMDGECLVTVKESV